ncbi:hypothetical protein [Clostridium psychrophilum]|uniref:hypothetical protein n=1 Tax=Clostridium psychrophilum TaxID=132926 RepID=UPI001C0BF0B1|nr:hypothetical protein [Clostridium psychrophilum]MBU3182551.1 hypothetical protein [Clostridium psychrophilum]
MANSNLIKIIKLEIKAFFRQYFKSVTVSDTSFIIGTCFLSIVSSGFYLLKVLNINQKVVYNIFTILTIIIAFNLQRDSELFKMLHSKSFIYSKILPLDEKYIYYIKILKYELLKLIDFGYLLIIVNFNFIIFKYKFINSLSYLILDILLFLTISDIKQTLNLYKYNRESYDYIKSALKSIFTGIVISILYLIIINFFIRKESFYISSFLKLNWANFYTIMIFMISFIIVFKMKFIFYKKIDDLVHKEKSENISRSSIIVLNFIDIIMQKDILVVLRKKNLKIKIIEKIIKYNVTLASFLFLITIYNSTEFFLINKSYILGFIFTIIFMYDSLFMDITSLGNEGKMIKIYITTGYNISKLLKSKVKLSILLISFFSMFSLLIIELILRLKFIEFVSLNGIIISFSICISYINVYYRAYNTSYENSLIIINKISLYKSLIVNCLLMYVFGISFLIIDQLLKINNSLLIVAIEIIVISSIIALIYRKKIGKNKKEFYGEYAGMQE